MKNDFLLTLGALALFWCFLSTLKVTVVELKHT